MISWLRKPLPPGLRELAEAEELSQAQVEQLASAWDTIRGRRPGTMEEWLPMYEVIKEIWREESEL